ncbi:MAG: hypothetical protein QM813_00825 [Verrucomicrobiota bacterium]
MTLQDMVKLGRATGLADNMVRRLEKYASDFMATKPTATVLRGAVQNLTDKTFQAIRDRVYDRTKFAARIGMEIHWAELQRIFLQWGDVLNPPKPQPAQLDASTCTGAQVLEKKAVPFWGDSDVACQVVEKTLELLSAYTKAIGKADFDAAYRMTGSGLQARMPKKRFISIHEQAAKLYQGSALEFHIDSFVVVYADRIAAEQSNSDKTWPKATPQGVRRARLIGFWIRDRAAQTGCWGGFWITEESSKYRIDDFNFYE